MAYDAVALPFDLQYTLARTLRLASPPETLGMLVELMRDARSQGTPILQDLVAEAPTRHVVQTTTHTTAFVYCALDGLLLPQFSGGPLDLLSACPHCGQPVAVHSDDGQGVIVSPAEAVLSFGAFLAHTGTAQETVCPAINLFPSAEHYASWTAEEPTVSSVPLPFADAWALSRALAQAASPGAPLHAS